MPGTSNQRYTTWWPSIDVGTLTPVQLTLSYLLFGAGALYVSDVLLPSLVSSRPLLTKLRLANGFLEVVVTGLLIYGLTAYTLDSLAETNEHLAAARRELSVLHRLFRHNLRNDVTVVAGHAETLEDEVDRPQLEDHCDAIQRSCEDLITYTEKAKLVADLNRNGVETTEIDVTATVRRVAERLEPLPPGVTFSVTAPDDQTVVVHEYLEFAIAEVVENALLHNDTAQPTVSVTVDDDPERVDWTRLRVKDDGPGIPEEELDALATGEQPLQHGSGVGLWVANWIVVQSGGDFAIENTGSGCRATMRLPTPETTPADKAEAALRRFLA